MSEEEPPPLVGALATALVQAPLLAAGFLATGAFVDPWARGAEVLLWPLGGLVAAQVALAASFVERRALARRRSVAGDSAVGLGVLAVAVVASFAVVFQVLHVVTLIETGSPFRAIENVADALGRLRADEVPEVLGILASLCLPLGLHAFARQRRWRPAAIAACTVAPGLAWGMVVHSTRLVARGPDRSVFAAVLVVAAITTAPAAQVADRLLRRWWPRATP